MLKEVCPLKKSNSFNMNFALLRGSIYKARSLRLDCLWPLKCGQSRSLTPVTLPLENLEPKGKISRKDRIQTVKINSKLRMIMDFFDVSKSIARGIITSDQRLRNVESYDLDWNRQVLEATGLPREQFRKRLQLFYYCPITTEHRIAIYQELGLENLSPSHYLKFYKIFKSPVSLIKDYKLLPKDYDASNVLPSLGVPKAVCDEVIFPKEVDRLTLGEVHQCLSLAYLCWYFQCEKSDIDYIHNTYPSSQLKSMNLQNVVFKRLKEIWNFTNEEILRHGYLFCCSPVNVENIENNVQHLCSADTRTVAHLTPRILNIAYHRLCKISNILIQLGVPKGAIMQNSHVLTLHPDTLEKRIKEIQNIPEFAGFNSHPRMLRLVYYNTRVKERLELLREIKDTRSMPSLNILTGQQYKFKNYVALGYLKINRQDIETLLSKQLRVSSEIIRRNFRLQSFRLNSSIVSVEKNLTHLRAKNFSNKQILTSLEVLLYPSELVEYNLEYVQKQLQETCPNQELISVPYSLQLLLYRLNKECTY